MWAVLLEKQKNRIWYQNPFWCTEGAAITGEHSAFCKNIIRRNWSFNVCLGKEKIKLLKLCFHFTVLCNLVIQTTPMQMFHWNVSPCTQQSKDTDLAEQWDEMQSLRSCYVGDWHILRYLFFWSVMHPRKLYISLGPMQFCRLAEQPWRSHACATTSERIQGMGKKDGRRGSTELYFPQNKASGNKMVSKSLHLLLCA